ncbi:hypothetical protein [Aestuariibacter sp. A3R04]|uniref:hypothetical protein n=1 Tax=Aestuariibacter sp. A3R04 TaxID=2841571 RepID=UPI001C0A4A94|nr:hypothetical protein [Aestuariibacter sp. A3R04]MBU3020235.1 hypothetical protein [Aestuariibacter sp. A3R04]
MANYLTGALDYYNIRSERDQRDFNCALGLPILTAFCWMSIRAQQQNVASTIMRYLLDNNRLCEFAEHRDRLSEKLRQHTITAATFAISFNSVYLISEELLAIDLAPKTLVLDLISYPFWFFFWLFLFQIVSSTRYMRTHFVQSVVLDVAALKALRRVASLAIENAMYGLIALIIAPVFWFNRSIPFVDIVMVIVFFTFLTVYVIWPAIEAYRAIGNTKHAMFASLSSMINQKIPPACSAGSDINNVSAQQDIEVVASTSSIPTSFKQLRRVLLVLSSIPLSWFILMQLEQLVA